jgi:hypothetical protein
MHHVPRNRCPLASDHAAFQARQTLSRCGHMATSQLPANRMISRLDMSLINQSFFASLRLCARSFFFCVFARGLFSSASLPLRGCGSARDLFPDPQTASVLNCTRKGVINVTK